MSEPLRRKAVSGYLQNPHTPQTANTYNHSRTRSTSSNVFPHKQQLSPTNMQVRTYTSRRTPSNATYSTTSSSGNSPLPYRHMSEDLQRSTSSRSGGLSQPTGYVALMRKQKATVWCDRAQHEDPRLLAQQKAAKVRASREVVGGPTPHRVSTSGSASLAGTNRVTAKIRHHGKAGLVGYSPGDLVGGVGGVPMRLSASEVEGGDSDDDADSSKGQQILNHRRTGSGRSSTGSRRGLTYSRRSTASSTVGKWSSGNTPPSERQDSIDGLPEVREIPLPDFHQMGFLDGNADGTRSAGSGSSGERADILPIMSRADASRLVSNSLLKSTINRTKSARNPEDLRRRGSVDERTMTMSAGRLYIANPDADSG